MWWRLVAIMVILGAVLFLGLAPTCASNKAIQRQTTVHSTSAPISALDAIERSPANIQVFHWINSRHNPLLDHLFLFVRFLGSGWILMPLILFIVLRRREFLTPLVFAVTIETLIVLISKEFFNQPRPLLVLGSQNVHLMLPYAQHSFPSGDAAMACVVAIIMSIRAGIAIKIAWLLYALLIAYERVYLGVHFPLDVVGGALIGIVSAWAALIFIREKVLHPQLAVKDKQTSGEEDEQAVAA